MTTTTKNTEPLIDDAGAGLKTARGLRCLMPSISAQDPDW